MKDEYDFSGAERGKFFRPGARVQVPLYLDEQVLAALKARAEARGLSVSELVAELLKKSA